MIKKFKNYFIALAILSTSLFTLSFTSDYFQISKNLDIFITLYRELNSSYVDDIEPSKLIKAGIDAMLKSLDPYTQYIPESELEDYKMNFVNSQYGGIGASIGKKDGKLIVLEVYENFAAQKADIRVGDEIINVNGMPVNSKTSDELSELLKGQRNSTIKIIVSRAGESPSIEKLVTREDIKFKNVPYFGMLNDSVGYIKLVQFLENSGQEVADALKSLKEKNNVKALVFDLRGNGGGILQESVKIVNLFVPKGSTIVTQKGRNREGNVLHIAQNEPIDLKIPLIVLTDRGSASASEIVAGAIQDMDRGVIVGQRSFGKGLVQQTLPLTYNSLLKVTIAKYYTPSGRCIQALDYTHRRADGSVDRVADSLISEYKTLNGRSVYDGSGIYPDITTERPVFHKISYTLTSKYVNFDYATLYKSKNASIAKPKDFRLSDAEYDEFVKFAETKNIDYSTKSEKSMIEFKKIAEKENYFAGIENEYKSLLAKIEENKKDDLIQYKSQIKQLLEYEIASRYYFQNGRLEASFKYDVELAEAFKIFKNKALYNSILKGENTYKTIGKPSSTELAKSISEEEEDDEN